MANFDWQAGMAHPLTLLGAGMMAGSDPRRTGLGGIGAGLLQTESRLAERAELAEEQDRARMLADLKMQQFKNKQRQAQAEQQARQSYAQEYPRYETQIMAGDDLSDFQLKMATVGYDPARYREVYGPGAGPQVDINMPGEATEEQKVVGKYYGQQFTQLMDAERQARTENARLDRLDALFNEAYTGAGGKQVQSALKALQILGIDTEGVGEAEAGTSLSAEMALQLRNPAGGAGMPGAMSDKDREFLQSMVPSLATTDEGRKIMIDTKKKLNQRSMKVAKMARDYRRQHGRLDENFYDQLAAYADANPLFDQSGTEQAPSANGINVDQSAIDAELRRRGLM